MPVLDLGASIKVEGADCIVAANLAAPYQFGHCEIVCNPMKPANRSISWNGVEWVFFDKTDFGGYAEKSSRFWPAIQILRDKKR